MARFFEEQGEEMILVFGQNGQLASAFRKLNSPFSMKFVGSAETNLLEVGSAAKLIEKLKPDLVINCAAYTSVDRAETETQMNTRLNTDVPGEIGVAAQHLNIPVLHFSTDYVYSGLGSEAQSENAPLTPQNAYGAAKLDGEKRLVASGCSCHIIRISWVYSSDGVNFVKTMLRLAQDREELKVVADQIGSPMSAHAIAKLMMNSTVPKLLSLKSKEQKIYNLSSSPFVSWHEFAKEIFSSAGDTGFKLKVSSVLPIPGSVYVTAAKRPLNSRMNASRFEMDFHAGLPDWRESLRECLQTLKSEEVKS